MYSARSSTAGVWQPSPARHPPRNGASASRTSSSARTATSYACSPRIARRASSASTSEPPIRSQEPRKRSRKQSKGAAAPSCSNHERFALARSAWEPSLKDGTHDEHPSARHEMRQVVLQVFDQFARLLLEALHCDDLRDQDVIGLTERLSGHVRRPRKTPLRHRVKRSADDVPIARHQALKVVGQIRGAQFEPHEKRRGRTHPRSVVHNRTWTVCHAGFAASDAKLSSQGRLDARGEADKPRVEDEE